MKVQRPVSAPVRCLHCGLPAPAPTEPEAPTFCCSGCRSVYEAIHGAGLDRFYELPWTREAASPAQPSQHRYEEFDDESFLAQHAEGLAGGRLSVELYLEGLHCASCIWLLERVPQVLPGVQSVRIHMGRRVAQIAWDPNTVRLSEIARTLDRFGYPVHPHNSLEAARAQTLENRQHLARVGLAGALAGNVMLLAFALYGGAFSGIAERYENLLRGTSLVLTLIAVAGPGRVFFRGAWSSWKLKRLHMDVPVAIALSLGTGWGAWLTLRGHGEVYFESITAVIFLLLIGRWLQFHQQKRASEAVELTRALIPRRARRWNGSDWETVPHTALRLGDRLQVLAQESLPCDGEVLEGHSSLDASRLSGESRPVPVGPGDPVFAGTVNLGSTLELRAEAVGSDSRLASLMRLVEEGARNKPRRVLWADRLAHRFVFGVLLLAAATLGLWLWRDPSRAVDQTIALLIVTCPCALGLATPLAYQAAIAAAARAGLLIKDPDALERVHPGGLCLLDKTGTMTHGRMTLAHWWGAEDARSAVLALERDVEHSIARALVEGLSEPGAAAQAKDVQAQLGRGIQGTIDGHVWRVGSPRWLVQANSARPAWWDAAWATLEAEGLSPVVVERDGALVALAALGDSLAEDTPDAIRELRSMGWEIEMWTGDSAGVAQAIGQAAGLPAEAIHAEQQPEEKLARIQAAQPERRVLMVGDGVNDAAALAAADCGVAAHGGAEASLEAADACLLRPGLRSLIVLLRGSQRIEHVVKRNAAASLFYNGIGAWGAIAGWIQPWMAAILMPLSSLTVITLSFRSHTFDAPETHAERKP